MSGFQDPMSVGDEWAKSMSPRDRRRREAAKAELNRKEIPPLTPRQKRLLKRRP